MFRQKFQKEFRDILFSNGSFAFFIEETIDNESREFNIAAELKCLENDEEEYFRA